MSHLLALSNEPEWSQGFLVAPGVVLRRSAVIGFRVRHVRQSSMLVSWTASACLVATFLFTGIAAVREYPVVAFAAACLCLPSFVLAYNFPRGAAEHWVVDALTMGGPVEIYWVKTESQARSTSATLTTGMERD